MTREAEDRNPQRLPSAVHDLAIRLGVKPQDNPPSVGLTQTGRMKTDLKSSAWKAFTATQTISNRTCEFDWRASLQGAAQPR